MAVAPLACVWALVAGTGQGKRRAAEDELMHRYGSETI